MMMRFQSIKEATGLSKSHLYALIRRGEFPAPVRLSERAVAWRESDVTAWLDSRPCARAEV